MRSRGIMLASVALSLAACSGGTGASGDSDGLPGGSAGADVLEDAGLLQDGVVTIDSPLPEDQQLHGALCDYLFGSPEEVAEAAGLPTEATHADGLSWEDMGAGGKGVTCAYEVDGSPDRVLLLLRLWSKDTVEGPGDATTFVELDADGEYAAAGYFDEVEDGLDEAGLRQWLTEASERFTQ